MAAKFQQTQRFQLNKETLFNNCKMALISAGCTLKFDSLPSGIITGKFGANLFSWGEEVTVTITDNGDVTIKSACVLPTQIIDWGRNKKNVIKIFSLLAVMNGRPANA